MKNVVQTSKAPKPVGAYSQAVRAGKFLFVSGQLGMDPKTGRLVATDIVGQTERTLIISLPPRIELSLS